MHYLTLITTPVSYSPSDGKWQTTLSVEKSRRHTANHGEGGGGLGDVLNKHSGYRHVSQPPSFPPSFSLSLSGADEHMDTKGIRLYGVFARHASDTEGGPTEGIPSMVFAIQISKLVTRQRGVEWQE